MWGQNRSQSILLLIGSAVVIAVVVPVVAYYSTLSKPRSEPPLPTTTTTPTTTIISSTSSSPTSSIIVRTSTITSSTSPSTTTSTTSSAQSLVPITDLDEIERRLLLRHNELRALHGAPNMTWNSELTDFAAKYAASNFSCDNVQLIHSGGPYGENLAAGYVGGDAPVQAWYDEIHLYNYDDPKFTEETGHFTQLIWNTSVELGCAIVVCGNAWRQYTICEYTPRGNIVGSNNQQTAEIFTQHVWRLLDDRLD